MGLPVWRTPSPERRKKEAVKSDVTAPARSPIRRRSSFTSRRARPARALPSPRPLDSNLLAPDAHLLQFPPYEPPRRHSGVQVRLPPPPVPESRHYARPGETGREAAYRTIYELGSAAYAGTSTAPGNRARPAYTPNFAPATASWYRRIDPDFAAWADSHGARNAPERAQDDGITEAVSNHVEEGSDDAVDLPPLRRMGRRTVADGPLPSSSLRESWSPATTVDGLGDRERSLSPVDDPWDTFLSTVAPDPLAPTADSSFTSAAASASFTNSSNPSSRAGSSNSNSAASERTHLTVPSRRDSPPNELFLRACDTSDSDTASDTEAEAEADDFLRAYHVRQRQIRREHEDWRRNRRTEARPLAAGRAPVASQHGSRNRQLDRPLSDQMDGPAEVPSNTELERQSFDQEIRDARDIVERLVQSEGISDEFWASVGLTRSMADRVERIQQRERP